MIADVGHRCRMNRPLLVATMLLLTTALHAAPTLCQKDEVVAFSCQTDSKNRIVSLCLSKDFGAKSGYIVYRFGPAEKPELVFPKSKTGTQSHFAYDFTISPDHIREASTATVTFKNGGATYTIFREIFDATVQSEGIRVLFKGKETMMACTSEAEEDLSRLSVLWKMERRCGWIDNPTPGNWWIEDSEGSWTISAQGGYQADGEMPDFESSWVRTNGYHGYGCACMTAQVDHKNKQIKRYSDVKVLPVQQCQSDKKLKRR